ncbi:MAG: hypothetical protein KGV57_04305, partial [Fusobacterium sp.]|nr:hypothetical protein [Fusobacterium sp.]
LGIFTGSDILVDKNNNRPFACKMNFEIYAEAENWKKKFVDLIKKLLFLPKGSYVEITYDDKRKEKIDIGEYDVLALGIDTRGLPEEIIQKYNGGKLIERIRLECSSKQIDGGYYFNYDETPERLWVRFLGINYSEMEKVIKKSIKNYPLCKDTVITNETNLNKKEQKETNKAKENIFIN